MSLSRGNPCHLEWVSDAVGYQLAQGVLAASSRLVAHLFDGNDYLELAVVTDDSFLLFFAVNVR